MATGSCRSVKQSTGRRGGTSCAASSDLREATHCGTSTRGCEALPVSITPSMKWLGLTCRGIAGRAKRDCNHRTHVHGDGVGTNPTPESCENIEDTRTDTSQWQCAVTVLGMLPSRQILVSGCNPEIGMCQSGRSSAEAVWLSTVT